MSRSPEVSTGRLAGKSAVVLGATGRGNMGQHIARRFVEEGAEVVVAGRRGGLLRDFADEIGAKAMACDITVGDELIALAEFAMESMGRIDIAVNTVGKGLVKPFLETTEEELRYLSDLQFKGVFQFMQAMLPRMTRGGSVIQISSVTSVIMYNDHAAYMATKAAGDHIVRCVANEWAGKGIRANTISPGLTDTPLAVRSMTTPGFAEAFARSYPLGRLGTSADVAAAAVWLASDECYMTGENLQVNGGLTLRRFPDREEIAASVARATSRV